MNNTISTQVSGLILAVVVTAGTLLGVDHLAQREYADNAVATSTDVAVQQVVIVGHRAAARG